MTRVLPLIRLASQHDPRAAAVLRPHSAALRSLLLLLQPAAAADGPVRRRLLANSKPPHAVPGTPPPDYGSDGHGVQQPLPAPAPAMCGCMQPPCSMLAN
jgi:hypothetical protein